MSKTEGFTILDTQNAATGGDKGGRKLHQAVGRKKMADISNLHQNLRLSIEENKPQFTDTTHKDYIDKLRMENATLVKMLVQRNKIIEQSGAELDRLRINLVKMQEQNRQLAVSNSQMLMELNSGKERLKVLQHQVGCTSSLLKARKLEPQVKERKRPCQDAAAGGRGEDDEKHHKTQHSFQSDSLGSSDQQHRSDQKPEYRRLSARRRSTKFEVAELKPTETENSLPEKSLLEKVSISENATEGDDGASISQTSGRLSCCRPMRQAAKKVQSYKERSVKIKMRRSE